MNLITAFIELVSAGSSFADGIRAMNSALGKKYTHTRLRQWERGDGPSHDATDYMLSIVLSDELEKEGVKATKSKQIIRNVRYFVRSNLTMILPALPGFRRKRMCKWIIL
jgi:hypothetical protein